MSLPNLQRTHHQKSYGIDQTNSSTRKINNAALLDTNSGGKNKFVYNEVQKLYELKKHANILVISVPKVQIYLYLAFIPVSKIGTINN